MATRDPEATKARILAAALHEFSAKGIAGARVDAIAARAKVNKRMLYYYFGSKEGLFREILQRRMHERSAALGSAGVAGENRMTERATRIVDDAQYTRLLMWEALETDPTEPENAQIRREFFTTWVEAVTVEQAAGNLAVDLDPEQLVLSEIFLVLGPMLLPQITYLVTGSSVADPGFVARHAEFLEAYERRITAP